MRLLTRLCCVLFVALLPLLYTSLTPTASASNFTVNSLADTSDANTSDGLCADSNGVCTLRAAIQQANADAPGDAIGFSVSGTINLTGALPDLSKNVTITGPGAAQLTVRRNTAEAYRIFTVTSGISVSISKLTISNGQAPTTNISAAPGGGGIYNAGNLTLDAVTVTHNSTPSTPWPVPFTQFVLQGGGGIQNDGMLTMKDCNVTENSTGTGVDGNSNVSGGNGGGIFNAGTLSMENCAVSSNLTGDGADSSPNGGWGGSGGAGGGIYNAPSGARQVSATLTNCNVSMNVTGGGGKVVPGPSASTAKSGNGGAGGGIYNASTMTISKSSISGNNTGIGANAPANIQIEAGKGGAGGGIYNDVPASGGEMKLTNCVISGNKTGAGGVGSGVVQSNGNGGDGGGIYSASSDATLKVSQATVVSNQTGIMGDGGGHDGVGGGIYGAMRVRSSVIAFNYVRFPTNLSDVAGGPALSYGYNFLGHFGTFPCCTGMDFGGAGGLYINLGPDLIPLPDSLLLDSGLARDTDDNPVTTDKRGATRPFDFPAIAPLSPGGDNSDIGAFERLDTDPTPTPTPTPTTVQFTTSSTHVAEGCAQTELTITRSGPKDGTTVARYVVYNNVMPGASQRGDFTYETGLVTFAPGEDTKTIPVLLSEDSYAEGPEVFLASLTVVSGGQGGAPAGLVITIDDNDATDGTTNPIDDNATFVCQHYHDFLNRHPDSGGLAFWKGQLDACGADAACLDRKRVDVSAAFFLSIEFLNTGYYVIRMDKVAFGDQLNNPTYTTFLDHAQAVGRGVVVGQPGYEALLDANKNDYASGIAARSDFQTAHAGQTAAQFVDSLFANVSVTPTAAERDAAISAYSAGGQTGQAAALRSVTESGSVYNKLYNQGFVLMQYFAYLRRDPNAPPDTNFNGYNFWLNKLNSVTLPGEDARDERVALARVRRAEMIRAFLLSLEYRGRFGGDASRGN